MVAVNDNIVDKEDLATPRRGRKGDDSLANTAFQLQIKMSLRWLIYACLNLHENDLSRLLPVISTVELKS